MVFEPGKTYYMLSPEQYNEMLSLLADFLPDCDLANNFVADDDGNYWCAVDSGLIDSDEYSFLEDFNLLNALAYKKSTQSTSFFD